jgi:hypothetical protein
MDYRQRVVLQIPLQELWTERGPLQAVRQRRLSQPDLAVAFGSGPMLAPARLVVADVGLPLRWLDTAEVIPFWRKQAQGRIVDPATNGFRLEDFPGEFCFIASEWREPNSVAPIYLFEHHH